MLIDRHKISVLQDEDRSWKPDVAPCENQAASPERTSLSHWSPFTGGETEARRHGRDRCCVTGGVVKGSVRGLQYNLSRLNESTTGFTEWFVG